MKNYLLTIIGKFETEKICNEIGIALSPVVDSPTLKYTRTNGVLLFHFQSDVFKEELYTFIEHLLMYEANAFILSELTDNVTLSIPEKTKNHLLNLNDVGDDSTTILDMKKVKNNLDWGSDSMDDEDMDEFEALILDYQNSLFKKPTLNQILDKITSTGYESLSQFEIDTLESYSKN